MRYLIITKEFSLYQQYCFNRRHLLSPFFTFNGVIREDALFRQVLSNIP